MPLSRHLSGPWPATCSPGSCAFIGGCRRSALRTLSDLYGVLLSQESLYELFDRHTAWVYEKFAYLFELDELDYCLVAERLQSVVLRQADVDRDARAPRAHRFLSEGLLGSHGLPATYNFDWCRYRGRYRVQVGDRAYHVMRWLLTAPYFPHAPVAFANYALSQPASDALADAEHAAAWLDSCWVPLPDAVCRRILGRLLAFLRPFTEPQYRAAFSCSPARSPSSHSYRELLPSLVHVFERSLPVAFDLSDRVPFPLRRALLTLVRRQWHSLIDLVPVLNNSRLRRCSPVLICDRYERLVADWRVARADRAQLFGSSDCFAHTVVIVRSLRALVEAVGSARRARALLGSFRSVVLLPGAMREAGPMASWVVRRFRSRVSGDALSAVRPPGPHQALVRFHDGTELGPPQVVPCDELPTPVTSPIPPPFPVGGRPQPARRRSGSV